MENKEKKKPELLEEKLEIERQNWNEAILELVKAINHIDKISETQVLMLSYRHQLVDKILDLKSLLNKQYAKIKKLRQQKFIEYKTNYNIRMNKDEINDFIDSDLTEEGLIVKILENYIQFFQMCIETLDKTGYAISNKISLEKIGI